MTAVASAEIDRKQDGCDRESDAIAMRNPLRNQSGKAAGERVLEVAPS